MGRRTASSIGSSFSSRISASKGALRIRGDAASSLSRPATFTAPGAAYVTCSCLQGIGPSKRPSDILTVTAARSESW